MNETIVVNETVAEAPTFANRLVDWVSQNPSQTMEICLGGIVLIFFVAVMGYILVSAKIPFVGDLLFGRGKR